MSAIRRLHYIRFPDTTLQFNLELHLFKMLLTTGRSSDRMIPHYSFKFHVETFLDDLSKHAAHGIYQRDIFYDILSVTPPLLRDDQAGLLQAAIFVKAKQNLVWLMSLTTQSNQRGNEVYDFLKTFAIQPRLVTFKLRCN